MRPLFTLAAIAACLLASSPARADDTATTGVVPTPVTIEIPRATVPSPPRTRPLLRPLVYGLQAIDAVVSSAALRRAHRYEANPMMGPFSHGGAATLALGFALGDLARARLFRHAPGAAAAVDAAQGASNLDGIRTTLRSLHAP